MTKFLLSTAAVAALALVAAPASAATTVVNFDNLTGFGTLADGYGGINWNQNFFYYDTPQNPYTASSPNTRIFSNYGLHPAGQQDQLIFNFPTLQKFIGLFAAGAGQGQVSYDLYKGGILVGSSASIVTNSTPTFLGNSYTGTVDEVRINGQNGFSVFDDVTYASGAVPEPAAWALMLAGFGLVGGAMRRRQQSVRVTYA